MSHNSQNLGQLLAQIATLLANASFDRPQLEAQWLLCDGLRITPSQLHMQKDRVLPQEQVARIHEYAQRRQLKEPLAYICQEVNFSDLSLLCDRRALIPRPETEQLAQIAAAHRALHLPKTILDLGTGCGCLALFLKKKFKDAFVVGTDLSASALDLARENSSRCELNVQWKLGNWWKSVEGRVFDLIVTNPPYIEKGAWYLLDPQVRDFEPHSALVAGSTGLESLECILEGLAEHLEDKGTFFAEIGYDQASKALALATARGLNARILPDLWGKQRFLLIE